MKTEITISQREYNRRVRHNTKLVKYAVDTNRSIFDILKHVATLEHGVLDQIHDMELIYNIFDIIPALYLGILPTTAPNGFDAIEMTNSEIVEFELKMAVADYKRVWTGNRPGKIVTENTGLYTGLSRDKNRKTALTSALNGSFQISSEEQQRSKKRETILMVMDRCLPRHSGMSFRLGAAKTLELIKQSTNAKRDIKLGSFLLHGKQIPHVHDTLYWNEYKGLVRNNVDRFEDWHLHHGANYDICSFRAQYNDTLTAKNRKIKKV